MAEGPPTLDAVDWRRYNFIDLGASKGGSLMTCAKKFDAHRGLGIELNPAKIQRTRDGLDVVHGDARHLAVSDVVRFVSAVDFLEHLPDLGAVEQVLAAAAEAATDFVYISHPSFEGEYYLKSLGVIQYWHHWTGHKAHVRVSDYCAMFDRLGLHTYAIKYIDKVETSDHYSILPGAPLNQGRYDPHAHGPRPSFIFEEPIWRAQRIFVALRPFAPDDWKAIAK